MYKSSLLMQGKAQPPSHSQLASRVQLVNLPCFVGSSLLLVFRFLFVMHS